MSPAASPGLPPAADPSAAFPAEALRAHPAPLLVRAARGEPLDRPPVWFMRQAGRSLPEYRELRRGTAMLAACSDTATIVEATLQPVRRYGVDAAILFSDIVLPLAVAGFGVTIEPGVGPVVAQPVRSLADVERIPVPTAADLRPVTDAVRALVAELGSAHDGTPLIGFAGAPFTVGSYLVEGGPSRDHARTKALMRAEPATWGALMARLAEVAAAFLRAQVDHGAQAVQLFDSWAGTLTDAEYRRYVLPWSSSVLSTVSDVPRIHFGVGTAELLGSMADAGADVVGVDWRTPLDVAAGRLRAAGHDLAVQGNLDPTVVFAPWSVVEAEVRRVVTQGRAARGHLFNLGHGVLPGTDPGVLARVVQLVRSLGGSASV